MNNPYGGVLLTLVAEDANRSLVTLAFAVVPVENGDHWNRLLRHCIEMFPGLRILSSDWNKCLRAHHNVELLQGHGIFNTRCVRHVVRKPLLCSGAIALSL
mmetsp:Transcript_5751/g.14629  ORF Transcript_5751/g.14629 Transcript_5751/m.14629 type:complete len:101 (-) Transcript_5751:1357-1659(-)